MPIVTRRHRAGAFPARPAVRPAALLAAFLAGAAVLAGCAQAPPAARALPRGAAHRPAFGYYLSLGDSLAFGFQAARFRREQDAHHYADFPGYTDLVAARLRRGDPGLAVANLGCPGQTSLGFRTGTCPYTRLLAALRRGYAGSQLSAALAFLAGHPGPGVITLALGADDVNALLRRCQEQPACVRAGLAATLDSLRTNVAAVLARLRAAAPRATVVVLQDYNPYAVLDPASDFLALAGNAALAQAAAPTGARLADAFPVFNPSRGETATLCRLTAFCSPDRDIHPTDAGYAVLARLLLAAIL